MAARGSRHPAPKLSRVSKPMLLLAGLFVPPAREMIEMSYEFDEPFLVDSSRFEQAFGLAPTPLDVAARRDRRLVAAAPRHGRRGRRRHPARAGRVSTAGELVSAPGDPVEVRLLRLRWSNAYLVHGDRTVLVDAGSPGDEAAILAALAAAGRDPRRPRRRSC